MNYRIKIENSSWMKYSAIDPIKAIEKALFDYETDRGLTVSKDGKTNIQVKYEDGSIARYIRIAKNKPTIEKVE